MGVLELLKTPGVSVGSAAATEVSNRDVTAAAAFKCPKRHFTPFQFLLLFQQRRIGTVDLGLSQRLVHVCVLLRSPGRSQQSFGQKSFVSVLQLGRELCKKLSGLWLQHLVQSSGLLRTCYGCFVLCQISIDIIVVTSEGTFQSVVGELQCGE